MDANTIRVLRHSACLTTVTLMLIISCAFRSSFLGAYGYLLKIGENSLQPTAKDDLGIV